MVTIGGTVSSTDIDACRSYAPPALVPAAVTTLLPFPRTTPCAVKVPPLLLA